MPHAARPARRARESCQHSACTQTPRHAARHTARWRCERDGSRAEAGGADRVAFVLIHSCARLPALCLRHAQPARSRVQAACARPQPRAGGGGPPQRTSGRDVRTSALPPGGRARTHTPRCASWSRGVGGCTGGARSSRLPVPRRRRDRSRRACAALLQAAAAWATGSDGPYAASRAVQTWRVPPPPVDVRPHRPSQPSKTAAARRQRTPAGPRGASAACSAPCRRAHSAARAACAAGNTLGADAPQPHASCRSSPASRGDATPPGHSAR